MEIKNQEEIKIGSEVGKMVNCSVCQKEGTTDEFTTLQGHKGQNVYLCSECKANVDKAFEAETKNPNILLAIVVGVIGGIIGGIIWYFITINTNYEIGYVSLGLGYLIGFGVYLGSGKKRGHKLQIISAIIAVIAIVVTEKFIMQYFVNDYLKNNPSEIPDYNGQKISVSLLNPEFWKNFISPIGLLIYAIGIYLAYKFCKPRKI